MQSIKTVKLRSMKNLLVVLAVFVVALLTPSLAHANLGDVLNSDEMSQEKFFIGNTEMTGLGDTFANFFSTSIIGVKDSSGKDAKQGFLPYVGKTIAFMYQKQPISSREYIADLAGNIGFPTTPKTQAQGIGYKALEPMIPLWKAFRNLAFSLYIIIFAVIGFMIMFRTKVNAQTVITIQNAIPNLIITLILITFSYAIVGFLVDIMYFAMYFVVFLAGANGLLDANQAIKHLFTNNAWSMWLSWNNHGVVTGVSEAIGDIVGGYTLGDTWGELIEGIGGSLAFLIVVAALAIQMLKLVWTLVQSYVMVLVMTITAPLQILMNALPGSNAFMTWLKKTTSYLAPFPVVAAMFLFAAILIGKANLSFFGEEVCKDSVACNPFGIKKDLVTDDSMWLPPFISFHRSDVGADALVAIIGFAIILMTPQAAKMAKDALQVKDTTYTAEIGAGIQAGTWPYRGIGNIREQRKQREQQIGIYQTAIERSKEGKPSVT